MSASRRFVISLSSVQKELQAERRAVKGFVAADPLLSRFFDLFVFARVAERTA